jgi:RNA polymerase sigma factor (sigma-70 family)
VHEANPNDDFSKGQPNGAWFTTTHWTAVLAARDENSPTAVAARERLCISYWAPLYNYIRRDGHDSHDAQDLTQEFLNRFFQKQWLDHLTHRGGKFRSFLLTFLKHFLSDQRDRAKALKRGGGQTFVSIDAYEAEERTAIEPQDGVSPDQIYERRWALAVMEQAANALRDEYLAKDKGELFEILMDLQPGKHGERSYAEIGATLGMSEQAFKNVVHKMRRQYSEMIRIAIAQTVSSPAEIDEEIQYLMRVLG